MQREVHLPNIIIYPFCIVMIFLSVCCQANNVRAENPLMAQAEKNQTENAGTLADKPTIVLGTTNAIETVLYQKALRVFTPIFNSLGYQLVIKTLPNKRSLIWANAGKIDGELFRISELDLKEFDQLEQVKEPIFTIDQTIFSTKKIDINGWKSLENYIVAYERGTKFIEKNHHRFKDTVLVNNMQQAMALVYHGRADITITSRETGMIALLQNKVYASKVFPLEPPLTMITLHLYLNKNNHPYLARVVSEQLKTMKENGTFTRLMASPLSQ